MTARKFDTDVEQGATYILKLTYKDGTGALLDLTGHSVQMQIRESVGGRILASASTANGRITVNNVGVIFVKIPPTAFADTKHTRGVYDLFLTYPDGTVDKLIYGDVTIKPAVTR